MAEYFDIGIITKPQGLKGEVRVMPVTDDPERFTLLDKADIAFDNKPRFTRDIEYAQVRPPFVIVKFKGIDDRTAAETLIGGVIKIPPEKALPLEEDEYYVRDLIDMMVETEDGEQLGILTEVLRTGANDVYTITTPDNKQILLPAIRQCILSVSVHDKRMKVRLMEGLRD